MVKSQLARAMNDLSKLFAELESLNTRVDHVEARDAVSETGFISCFAEPQEAAEFLPYKRGRGG